MRIPALLIAASSCLLVVAAGAGAAGSVNSAPLGALYVSLTGSDHAQCTQAAPCASFQRAYSLAQLGQIVYVESGAYPAQTLTSVPGKTDPGVSPHVTFIPAPGASVTVADFSIGESQSSDDGAQHLTVEGIRDNGLANGCDWSINPPANDITINDAASCSIGIDGATNITVENSDFYGCTVVSDDTPCTNSWIFPNRRTNDIDIVDNEFHDYRAPASTGVHFQCIFDAGGTNVTISGNKFWHCEYFDIFFQRGTWCGCHPDQFDGTVIEGNSFAEPFDGNGHLRNTAILVDATGTDGPRDFTLAYNSFNASTFEIENQPGISNFQITNNIIGQGDCLTGITYSDNVWEGGGPCNASDLTTAPYGYRLSGGRLVLSSAEAHAVQAIFNQCAAGGSTPAAIARGLAGVGAGGGWTRARVKAIVTDPVYLGRLFGADGADPPLVYESKFEHAGQNCGG